MLRSDGQGDRWPEKLKLPLRAAMLVMLLALLGCGGGSSGSSTSSTTEDNLVPTITSISPSSASAGGASFTLTVVGTGFISDSAVRWNGSARTSSYVSSKRLTATIKASDITAAGTASITVYNPSPGGGTSNAVSFTISTVTAVKILTTVLPPTGGNKSYYFILSASGGASPYTWSISSGSLPSGLTLDSNTGLISGTVSTSAVGTNSQFTVQIQDSLTSPQTATQALSINVLASLPRNDNPSACGGTDTATPISNGRLRASISPFGDIDMYSFHGTADSTVTIQTYADRLDLFKDNARDSYLDSLMEVLNESCSQLAVADDSIISGAYTYDSLIQRTLSYTGTYYIRVRELRGDGRPDLIYELSLSGAD
jgi:hypothetical protein